MDDLAHLAKKMSWRNIVRIWWVESYGFRFLTKAERTHTLRHEFPTHAVKVAAGGMAFWLVCVLLAWLDPARKAASPLQAFPLILCAAPLIALGLCAPDLGRRTIAFGEERVAYTFGRRHQRWDYDQIACVCFDMIPAPAGVVRVMSIVPRDGTGIVIGIPNRLELPKLIGFLKGKGVEIRENGDTVNDGRAGG